MPTRAQVYAWIAGCGLVMPSLAFTQDRTERDVVDLIVRDGPQARAIAAETEVVRRRLVPILMTALAAGLALVPIALSAGEPGSEIQAPMAMVIMFGLLSSTALNMVVVPILYERFGRPASAVLPAS